MNNVSNDLVTCIFLGANFVSTRKFAAPKKLLDTHPAPCHSSRSMNQIKQYRPAFFEGFENSTIDFSTTAELMEIPFVKNFRHEGFHQFSISDDMLMAEYRDGKEWWVVGRIERPQEVDLPRWDHGIYETEVGDIPGKDVASSCGDEVTLRDGRVVKRK